jgi:ankyrin repeat protein
MRGLFLLWMVPLSTVYCSYVWAASDSPVVLAAIDVASANSRNGKVCAGVASDPSRPDRRKLAALVASLPDINARYPFGYTEVTPLGLAVLADDVSLLEELFDSGARVRNESGDRVVMYLAAQNDSPRMIDALVRHGLDPNAREQAGFSPLMAAAWANRLDNVNALLKAGADPNVLLSNGNNALRGAVMCRNQLMADALLRYGARPNGKTSALANSLGIVLSEH